MAITKMIHSVFTGASFGYMENGSTVSLLVNHVEAEVHGGAGGSVWTETYVTFTTDTISPPSYERKVMRLNEFVSLLVSKQAKQVGLS